MLPRGTLLIPALLFTGAAIAGSTTSDPSSALRSPDSFAGIADRTERSRAMFDEMARVIQHPRCLNCHPATREPLQRDLERHQPAVSMDKQSRALECQTCHHEHNTPTFAGGIASIPGAHGWKLAPASMSWVGKSRREICQALKDPAKNGKRDLAAIHEHMAQDHLVGWAWHPGGTLGPAPGTQASFGALVQAWIDTGAACPAA
ncbi:Isoquinoline 1-oxidoreductase subunit [Novosphingobium resinovorum]|uniref:Isoquinoline 1-oxidoreductase subunit n=1 Tax=Novosphingobium resinovorum TaxID=158500 RepID=UPI002ED68D0E|nr:Isoquinoline 1-oxidoreductase subunit [Novosphingobium resinovorum]